VIHNRILILGASGFIGNAFYKELLSYFDVFGTYCNQEGLYCDNQVFYKFDADTDAISELLDDIQPRFIISAFIASHSARLKVHQELVRYCEIRPESLLVFVSSYQVFDAQQRFPSYEYDRPVAESIEGRQTIAIEKVLLEQLPDQIMIIRLPIVLGINSPLLVQLRKAIKYTASFEVFPKMIISATTDNKIAQQLHYILNKELVGIFHLASTDMVHHDDLFKEITAKLGDQQPVFKKVFSSNEDVYQAILPKEHMLPESYRITIAEVIEFCTLNEEIITFKNKL
jgi:dTDP-4-dehydrorhamnose reductase